MALNVDFSFFQGKEKSYRWKPIHFFNHSFIECIIRNPSITAGEIFFLSGIKNKLAFLEELGGLIKAEHLADNYGVFCPATIFLRRIPKNGKPYFKKIHLKYVPFKALQKVIEGEIIDETGFEDVDTFAFRLVVENIEISEMHQLYFKNHHHIKLDLVRFRYSLCAEYIDLSYNFHPGRGEFDMDV